MSCWGTRAPLAGPQCPTSTSTCAPTTPSLRQIGLLNLGARFRLSLRAIDVGNSSQSPTNGALKSIVVKCQLQAAIQKQQAIVSSTLCTIGSWAPCNSAHTWASVPSSVRYGSQLTLQLVPHWTSYVGPPEWHQRSTPDICKRTCDCKWSAIPLSVADRGESKKCLRGGPHKTRNVSM